MYLFVDGDGTMIGVHTIGNGAVTVVVHGDDAREIWEDFCWAVEGWERSRSTKVIH